MLVNTNVTKETKQKSSCDASTFEQRKANFTLIPIIGSRFGRRRRNPAPPLFPDPNHA